jgi:multidrug efflux pump subunit AcrB
MVTLSGLIVSVGMVVDASIVVLENIYRRAGMQNGDIQKAAEEGAGEVALAITAGMMTTVVVLFPIMWAGGYSEQVMKPLIIMIISTLVASLLIAQTLIPLVSEKVLSKGKKKKNFLEKWVSRVDLLISRLTSFYLAILKRCLGKPVLTMAFFAVFFVMTVRTVPSFIGSELMPPMDTGIVTIAFDTPYYYTPDQAEQVLEKVEEMIYSLEGVEMVSSVLGAEPGLVSFNGGANAQSGTLTVNLVDRTRREKTIWNIEEEWREAMSSIEGVRSFRISEYGATPLATTKAPLDIIISGPEPEVLDVLAEQTINKLQGLKGITDVRRSWRFEKEEKEIVLDPYLASYYNTSVEKISQEVSAAIKGVRAGYLRLEHFDSIPIEVSYASRNLDSSPEVEDIYISTNYGYLPLKTLAEISTSWDQPLITREDLQNTIDITAVNTSYRISRVADLVSQRIKDIDIPGEYSINVSGTVEAMDENKKGMGKSLIFGLVLLYVLLVAMFNSFVHPLTIMSVIPLAVAGGLWGLFLLDKPLCMPATMGFILLGGTVVNNSILILDFILEARKRGAPKYLAIIRSVKLRTRPVLMTAISTVVGMTPLVLESAVGLERMSPLGIVAVFGLTLGTFLTMIFVPVFYSFLDNITSTLRDK